MCFYKLNRVASTAGLSARTGWARQVQASAGSSFLMPIVPHALPVSCVTASRDHHKSLLADVLLDYLQPPKYDHAHECASRHAQTDLRKCISLMVKLLCVDVAGVINIPEA